MWDLNISAQEGSRDSIFALRSKSHGPLSESRVLRRLESLPPTRVRLPTAQGWNGHFFWSWTS